MPCRSGIEPQRLAEVSLRLLVLPLGIEDTPKLVRSVVSGIEPCDSVK